MNRSWNLYKVLKIIIYYVYHGFVLQNSGLVFGCISSRITSKRWISLNNNLIFFTVFQNILVHTIWIEFNLIQNWNISASKKMTKKYIFYRDNRTKVSSCSLIKSDRWSGLPAYAQVDWPFLFWNQPKNVKGDTSIHPYRGSLSCKNIFKIWAINVMAGSKKGN